VILQEPLTKATGMNTKADSYFIEGCGRCELGGTPFCKVNAWENILTACRKILKETKLKENCKWGVPCYTYKEKNVLLLGAFKDFTSISFLKGVLLRDEHALLSFAGENSQTAKLLKIKDLNTLHELTPIIKDYIEEAIEIENSGEKTVKKNIEAYELPAELQEVFNEDESLQLAFRSLTPGRQRGYLIYFSQPKQAETRIRRIQKCRQAILAGKGLQD
jgi:uncharacterized protein YdeI (YjbR/CyaY-like superfamily)